MQREKAHGKKPKIVVIDADRVRASKLVDLLKKNDFKAVSYHVPLKAARFIRRKRPDAVVLEIIMPGRSGFEIAAQMQGDSLLCRTPIIFTSDIQNSAGGNHDYFPRPLNPKQLVAMLKKRIIKEN